MQKPILQRAHPSFHLTHPPRIRRLPCPQTRQRAQNACLDGCPRCPPVPHGHQEVVAQFAVAAEVGHGAGEVDGVGEGGGVAVYLDPVLVPVEFYRSLVSIYPGAAAGGVVAGEEVLGIACLRPVFIFDLATAPVLEFESL